MSNFGAFLPQGNTVAITTGASASTPVQAPGGVPNINTYLISATAAAFIVMAPASTAVVAPVSGTSANGIYIPAGVPVMLEGPPNAWISAIQVSAAGTVYVTPGEGGAH
jgi:hypothetical protein